ncbi:MAG: hypothetical protein J0L70_05430 [Leptolyngbya sp. UWPOB_LEPTO1]|uniref:hypothetical protein n=1 Tax=Leptolyngbya sp. UWPOB_LEPTO1 TaxID=2815653 RepID=UPI001AD377EB|nr:hypothetical protein [Leptolyngbya sp. UWPOB_LEPTO1]MBN8559943.1 hypothetical protein [Leptolyngbya sp. UWPOB_LEPTO1]
MNLLLVLLTIGAIAYFFLSHHNRQIQTIRDSDVVVVEGAIERYPNLPLGNFAVPNRFRSPDRVQVVFPMLTDAGDVEYLYSWHSLRAVTPMTLSRDHRQNKVRVMAELAPLIKEHLRLELDRVALENQLIKIQKLAELVAVSDLYSSQIGTYERAIGETEKLICKVEELSRIYVRMVKEALIGTRIAEFNPDLLLDLHVPLDEQYTRVKSEYQFMKDSAQAYYDLLKESQGATDLTS